MAEFRGKIKGSRGEVTRLGTKKSMKTQHPSDTARLQMVNSFVYGRLAAGLRLLDDGTNRTQESIDYIEAQINVLILLVAILDPDPEKREPWARL